MILIVNVFFGFFFRCVICNTSFATAQLVKEHITTHLAGLPFPCEKCDYSFETSEQLEEHEFKHAEMEYEEQIEKEVIKEAIEKGEVTPVPEDDLIEKDESEVVEYTIKDPSNTDVSIVPRGKKNNVEVGSSKKRKIGKNQQELVAMSNQEFLEEKYQVLSKKESANQENVHAANYAPFLKDEVDSDVEEMGIPQEATEKGNRLFSIPTQKSRITK